MLTDPFTVPSQRFLKAASRGFSIDPGSKDAAIRVPFTPGGITVHATDFSGGSGIAIIELYESRSVPRPRRPRALSSLSNHIR